MNLTEDQIDEKKMENDVHILIEKSYFHLNMNGNALVVDIML